MTMTLPSATGAGGFVLILTSVASLHLAALVGVLSADTAQTDTLTPPILSGILQQQPAAQATAVTVPAETQAVPPPQPNATPAAVSKSRAVKTKQHSAKTNGGRPSEQPPTRLARAEVDAPATRANKAVTTAANPVTPSDAARDMRAASEVPISAPLLNASAQFNTPPRYPTLSRKLREQGTVVLELTVLASGRVADVSVQQSSGYPRLDSAALSAVKHWQYQPAQRAGKAIDYRYRQRLEFSLTEGIK